MRWSQHVTRSSTVWYPHILWWSQNCGGALGQCTSPERGISHQQLVRVRGHLLIIVGGYTRVRARGVVPHAPVSARHRSSLMAVVVVAL